MQKESKEKKLFDELQRASAEIIKKHRREILDRAFEEGSTTDSSFKCSLSLEIYFTKRAGMVSTQLRIPGKPTVDRMSGDLFEFEQGDLPLGDK